MKTILTTLCLLFLLTALFAADPVVSNVRVVQRWDGSMLADIWYDLFDADGDLCAISFSAYDCWGSLVYLTTDVEWDPGPSVVTSGLNRHIIWEIKPLVEIIDFETGEYRLIFVDSDYYTIKIEADDLTLGPPAEFVLVESGWFNNGVSDVAVSAFYMADKEVTQSEYFNVMGLTPSQFSLSPETPVESVSWYYAIEYCNKRSIAENMEPCYSFVDGSATDYGPNPDDWPIDWDASSANHTRIKCNWNATGYRLPSEAEWEFAARGGRLTHNYLYSGSSNPDLVAWYQSNASYGTHIVGRKAPNELGLYDMSGNVAELLWDIWAAYPTGFQVNPHGPDVGNTRVFRGGRFDLPENQLRVNYRPGGGFTAREGSEGVGFRVCRSLDDFVWINGPIDINIGRTVGLGFPDELPVHPVEVTGFFMSPNEVNQKEWQDIMGYNPATGSTIGDFYPVYNISWYEAIKFCNLKSMAVGLVPFYVIDGSSDPNQWGPVPQTQSDVWDNVTWNVVPGSLMGYRLPTETEWEIAARGRSNTPDYLYSGSDNLADVAWYQNNNSPDGVKQIGQKTPNSLGLYDMSGNVFEWCFDWYGEYEPAFLLDPFGFDTGTTRVYRGGAYNSESTYCRVVCRNGNAPWFIAPNLGLRLCRWLN